MFDVRFWGAVTAAKVAKLRKEGSVTFTTGKAPTLFFPLSFSDSCIMIGMALLTPPPGWSIASATFGAIDGISRGLAVDMAPIRVNTVAPGSVKTEVSYPNVDPFLCVLTVHATALGHAPSRDRCTEIQRDGKITAREARRGCR